MRLALVTYALRVGGVESFLHGLAAQLRASGHDVTFVETEHQGEWSGLTTELGFDVISVPRRAIETRIRHCQRVARALHPFDALLINDAPLAMGALASLPSNVVAIPVLHMQLSSMISNATSASDQWQRVVCVSPASCEALVSHGDTRRERVVCIPNGVSVGAARSPSFTSAPLRVIYVGRIEDAQKNVLAMPRILRKLVERGTRFNFDVVGDGPDASRLVGALTEAGIPSVIHGRLSRERTLGRLAESDVLLLPSRFEGLPMVLLEAMASGVVPVATELSGSTDTVIESGVNGILASLDDDGAFADAIAKLEADRGMLAAMSARAQDSIRENFGVEKMASRYLELIEDCMQEIHRSPPARTGRIQQSCLGDFSNTPYVLVRPFRKILRDLGMYPPASRTKAQPGIQ